MSRQNARARLAKTFCKSTGQLRSFVPTPGSVRSEDGAWADVGEPRSVCLYRPRGNTTPEPVAIMDRTTMLLAWDDTEPWGLTHESRIVVNGQEFRVHDVDDDRTNRFLSTATVSEIR